MTPEQFCYWLQGASELATGQPNAAQWQQIKDHLALVFEKATPTLGYRPADFSRLNTGTPASRREGRLLC